MPCTALIAVVWVAVVVLLAVMESRLPPLSLAAPEGNGNAVAEIGCVAGKLLTETEPMAAAPAPSETVPPTVRVPANFAYRPFKIAMTEPEPEPP